MPKGEHFKKDNPRIHQVSFKVNKTELELLQAKVAEAGVSIPEWIRQHITGESNVVVAKPVAKPKPKAKKPPKKTQGPTDGVHRGEQTSLF